MIQRSAGNPKRGEARRKFTEAERDLVLPDRDDPRYDWKEEMRREMAEQRKIAVSSFKYSLLVMAITLISVGGAWWYLGVLLVAAYGWLNEIDRT